MSDQSDRLQRIATSLHAPERVLEAMQDAARSRPAPSTPAVARTETERRMAGIWARVLGSERLGVDDDFFALGGHSLQAVELIGGIRDEFGVELAIASMFLNVFTITELARQVDIAVLGQAPSEDVSAILRTVGEMSDEDVTAMLRKAE